MAVLIIIVEIPIVKIARGNANILMSGFTMELTSEKIKPAAAKSIHGSAKVSDESGLMVPSQLIHRYIPKLETNQRSRKVKICFLIID